MLNAPITREELKNYGASDLHVAAFTGDKEAIKRLLAKEPHLYTKRTSPSEGNSYDSQRLGGATALHYALLGYQYDIAELLLKDPRCTDIINATDSAGNSILGINCPTS